MPKLRRLSPPWMPVKHLRNGLMVGLPISRWSLWMFEIVKNVHDAATWSYIWRLAASGRVIAIVGGGPLPHCEQVVGKKLQVHQACVQEMVLKGLCLNTSDKESQQHKTDSDTALYLKQLGLHMHAHEPWHGSKRPHMKHVANRVGFMLESPQDPKTYLQNGEGDESASFWAWDKTRDLIEIFIIKWNGKDEIRSGAFGHPRKISHYVRPISLMWENWMAVALVKENGSWSLWAPRLRAAIKTSLLVLVEWHGISPPKLSKSLGLDQWKLKQHINQGHQPYRRDCRTCILNMAGSKPHWHREHAGGSAWTMSVDLVNLWDMGWLQQPLFQCLALLRGTNHRLPKSQWMLKCHPMRRDQWKRWMHVGGRDWMRKNTPLRGTKQMEEKPTLDDGVFTNHDESWAKMNRKNGSQTVLRKRAASTCESGSCHTHGISWVPKCETCDAFEGCFGD